jgi:glycosyltransferase involved in cell wall biosynthesis
MSDVPQFSIVTASYNQGRFIRDCIESVKSQTGVTWEHIIQDAGSTDETLAVLQEYPHLQITCERDKGMSDGINRGFLKARGEWVMWLNTDDYLLPGALAQVAEFAAKHPDADVIYGGWHFVDADRNITKTATLFPFDLLMLVHYGTYIGSTACFLKRRTVIEQGHLLSVMFKNNMDGEFYARLGRAGKKFLHLPRILAAFRLHGDNTSQKYRGAKSVAGILRYQLQYAEAATIRRLYGWTWFQEPVTNGIVDGLLFFVFRFKKIIVKSFYKLYYKLNR